MLRSFHPDISDNCVRDWRHQNGRILVTSPLDYRMGAAVPSKKYLSEQVKVGDMIWVMWPGGHKLCKVLANNNGNLRVETPNGGSMEVTNVKALRLAVTRHELIKRHGAPF